MCTEDCKNIKLKLLKASKIHYTVDLHVIRPLVRVSSLFPDRSVHGPERFSVPSHYHLDGVSYYHSDLILSASFEDITDRSAPSL
jgi:hypothetical protein